MAAKGENHSIGIDLGTTCSCVGVWRNGIFEMIPNERGKNTTPSYVAFTDTDWLIGDAAKNHYQVTMNRANTVFGVQRLIGRRFSDPSVQSNINQWPFKVIAGPGDRPMIVVSYKRKEKQFTPEEICSMLLAEMKEIAEAHLRCSVKNAVVTVPANFHDSQRQATKDACVIAGLNVLQIINEPTAVAMAYLLKEPSRTLDNKNVLIFNLGAHSLDVSLMAFRGGVFVVNKSTACATLGVEDFDNRIVSYYVEEFKRRHNKDISGKKQVLQRLRMATCVHAKRELLSTVQTTIQIDSLYDGMDFYTTITRGRFNQLSTDLFDKCIETVEKCLRDARTDKSSVHDFVLAGSSARMPSIHQLLEDFFDIDDEENKSLNLKVFDIDDEENKSLNLNFFDIDDEENKSLNLNPDEAATCGAAFQASFVSNGSRRMLLSDIMPFSLVLEIVSLEYTTVLFPRNTIFPVAMELNVYTSSKDQTDILLLVYWGEEDNILLGEVQLSGLSLGAPGTEIIKVRFEIDMNGILSVSAEDMEHNKITVQKKGLLLSKQEIEKMRMVQEEAEYRKKLDCKKVLQAYLDKIQNRIKADKIATKLGVDDKKRIEDAIVAAMSRLANEEDLVEAYEYKHRLKELEGTCELISR